jgi:CO/xanthine dehydrogenase Mo-binding subunit
MWYGLGTKMPAPAQVYLELLLDGKIGLFTGAAEMGQGITTALAQLAAEELGVPFSAITVTNADTDLTPPGAYPTASRQSMYSGNAIRQAASDLRGLLLDLASELLEDKKENIKYEQGQFFSPAYPDQRVSLARLAALCQAKGISPRSHGSYDTDLITGLDAKSGQGTPYMSCATATQLAEVEVNINTGAVKVLRVVAAQDVGKAINPRDVQGQIEGGIMMGLGFALTEEFVPGKTHNFSQYRIPRMKELPELIPLIVEVPEKAGPFGVKGLGECASLGTAPAIINALASATGKRIFRVPATRKRILEAIRTQSLSSS